MGSPELAATALALSVEDWGNLGSTNAIPETAPTADFDVLVERVSSLLLIRVVAIVSRPEEYNDLSTCTITRTALMRQEPWAVPITNQVVSQVRKFVSNILSRYKAVPYHNFEHACHVVVSCNKLIDLMIQQKQNKSFGLRHDPLLLFSLLFAALIHDVDHQGIPNRQLAFEHGGLALMYNDQSIAENQSLYVGFSEFLKDDYRELREVVFSDQGVSSRSLIAANSTALSPYHRFRAQVVNLVLTTDIASPDRTQIVKAKYKEAFSSSSDPAKEKTDSGVGRSPPATPRATSVKICSNEVCTGNGEGGMLDKVQSPIPPQSPPRRRARRRSSLFTNFDEEQLEEVDAQVVQKKKSRKKFGVRQSMDLGGEALEFYRLRQPDQPSEDDPDELKASVVLELFLTAADVAHNLQGFEQMVEWSDRLYLELQRAFLMGRGSDPTPNWFKNQIGFLDFYIKPLAERLEETGVLGYHARKITETVAGNKETWKEKGAAVTVNIIAEGKAMKIPIVKKDQDDEVSLSSDEASTDTPVLEPIKDAFSPVTSRPSYVVHLITLACVVLALFLQRIHMQPAFPFPAGSRMLNGTWAVKCGVFPTFLTGCENAYFRVDSNGYAVLYNENFEVQWEMKGRVCSRNDESCGDGLQTSSDTIGNGEKPPGKLDRIPNMESKETESNAGWE